MLLALALRAIFAPPREPSRVERITGRAWGAYKEAGEAAELFTMLVPPNEGRAEGKEDESC